MALNEVWAQFKSEYAREQVRKLVAETPFEDGKKRNWVENYAYRLLQYERIAEASGPKNWSQNFVRNQYPAVYDAVHKSLNPESYQRVLENRRRWEEEKKKEAEERKLEEKQQRKQNRKNKRETRKLWNELGGTINVHREKSRRY